MIPENDDLENQLRGALRREAAPTDFAAKIIARTPRSIARRPGPKRPLLLGMAAAVAAMAIVPSIVLDYQRREEEKGLKAKRDLLTALAITRDQLQQARTRVQQSTKIIP